MNEPEMELIRLHKRERHQTFVPSSTPIPPEFLDSKRKTILEFKNGKKEVKEDDWKASVKTKQFHSPQAWRGKTIFKILPGGIENRTSVKVRSTASGPKREESQMTNSSRLERENQRNQAEALLWERYQPRENPRKVLPPNLQEASLLGRYLRMETMKRIHSRILIFYLLQVLHQEAVPECRNLEWRMQQNMNLRILGILDPLQKLLIPRMRLSLCLPEVKH